MAHPRDTAHTVYVVGRASESLYFKFCRDVIYMLERSLEISKILVSVFEESYGTSREDEHGLMSLLKFLI